MQIQVILRQWLDEDIDPYAQMNADPEVMHFFPGVLSRRESEESFQRLKSRIEEKKWGLWAVEADGMFAGFTGLSEPKFTAPFTPCVEIGWRLRKEFWGKSIAFAAALQAEEYAFSTLELAELVSFTSILNVKSIALMERLGFTRDPRDDFDHPRIEEGHPLRPHVLYRKKRENYRLFSMK
jgi:RimJ/RimL family protein N-acetyltransferase